MAARRSSSQLRVNQCIFIFERAFLEYKNSSRSSSPSPSSTPSSSSTSSASSSSSFSSLPFLCHGVESAHAEERAEREEDERRGGRCGSGRRTGARIEKWEGEGIGNRRAIRETQRKDSITSYKESKPSGEINKQPRLLALRRRRGTGGGGGGGGRGTGGAREREREERKRGEPPVWEERKTGEWFCALRRSVPFVHSICPFPPG